MIVGWYELNTPPRHWGHYWLMSQQGYRLLAHYGNDSKWRGTDVGGRTFVVSDEFTHWTYLIEPRAVKP